MEPNYDEEAKGRVLEIYPFYIEGWGWTKEQALNSFKARIKLDIKFIKGHLYWRVKPELILDRDFSGDAAMWRVVGRAFSCLESLESISGMEELKEDVELIISLTAVETKDA